MVEQIVKIFEVRSRMRRESARPSQGLAYSPVLVSNLGIKMRSAGGTDHKPSPFLRWAGSKKKLLGVIEVFWSESFERYVEPFAGSACLFFRLRPKMAVLADKNVQLISTYRTVASRPRDVYRAVMALPRTPADYYRIRSIKPVSISKFEQAVRFIYLNRNCFNGIYRTNKKGEFNVPYGGEKSGDLVSEELFLKAGHMLRSASLRSWDFGTTLRHTKLGDFVYLDPPYAVTEERVFCEYSGKPFTTEDLNRLSSHLDRMDRRGVKFLVSYADSREARSIAANWNSQQVSVRRNIAGFAGARREAPELLFTNIENKYLLSVGGIKDEI